MMQIATTDTDTERLLKGSLLLQAEKQDHSRTHHRLFTTMQHLALFLEKEEKRWDSDEQFNSPEDAIRYLDAAKWMRDMGRQGGRIEQVYAWLKSYVPFGK